jgi:hypothetical protein
MMARYPARYAEIVWIGARARVGATRRCATHPGNEEPALPHFRVAWGTMRAPVFKPYEEHHHMRTIRFALALAAVVAATLFATGAVAASQGQSSLADARAATAAFHNLEKATGAQYAELRDAAHIACIANPGVGAMGIHYVNGKLVGSGVINALTPQALVYEPRDGHLSLVAVEYIAFQAPWDASHSGPPTLFGQEFMLTPDGNRFGIPAFYSLHVWLWKNNPSGMFSMWNPNVSCGAAG